MTKEECEIETSKAIMEMRNHIEELEEKISILLSCKNCSENKGGLLCQKEYEDKCLSQKIQYIKELKEEIAELEKENAELKDKLSNLASVAEVRLANWQKYKKENAELKAQVEKMKCWHKMDYNDKESCKKIPRGIQLLTEYDCGLFVAYCVNRWTGDHWEEHQYGITRWKEIKENGNRPGNN